MRILLDTNVLIAAFISRGVCSDLFEHTVRQHELITSTFILNELSRHLSNKFNYEPAEVEAVIELLHSVMVVVEPAKLENPICRDPDDDVILGTAVAGDVVCIVTGDKDLRILGQFESIDILNPSEFSEYEATRRSR